MKEDSMLFSVSPEAYAEYLEQLSDTEFWKHAYEKAHVPYSTHPTQALISASAQPDDTLACLTCDLRTARCLLPLTIVREILPSSQRITLLPDVPFWMLGILSWRSETIAVIDLCSYLTKSSSPPLQDRLILIVEHDNLSLALCVLSIISTMTVVDSSHITPFTLPPTVEGVPVGIVGVWEYEPMQQEKTFVLDIPALFEDAMQCIERSVSRE